MTNIESFYHNIRILLQHITDISDVKLFIESTCFWIEYGAMLSNNDSNGYVSEFTKIEWEFQREIRYIWTFFDKKNKGARANVNILINFLKEEGLLFSKMCFVGQLFPLNERLVFNEDDRKRIVGNLSKHVTSKLNDFRKQDKNNCFDIVKYMWDLDRHQVWANQFVAYLKSRHYNGWLLDCILYNQENDYFEINRNNIDRIFKDRMVIKKLDSSQRSLAYLLLREKLLHEVDETKYPILKKIKK